MPYNDYMEVTTVSYMIYLKKDEHHVYAYQATSYRDPVTRKPKSKRVYIGRVDPTTHEFLNPEDAQKLNPSSTKGKDTTVQKEEKATSNASREINTIKELNKINKTIQSQQITLDVIQKEQKEIRKLFEMIERAIHLSTAQV